MLRPSRLLWFRVRDGRRATWSVYFADLPSLAGLCRYDKRTIFVDIKPPALEQDETLLHELLHCAFGFARLNVTRRREELHIRRLSPQLYPLLRRLGLRWPARPDGYRAMRRRAVADSKY